MSNKRPSPSIRNVVETPWKQYPGHFGGALSKPLVRPETDGSQRVDYRISTYQPMAYVEVHKLFIPPGVSHSICNNGLTDLTFIVVTTPPEDE